MFIWINIYLIPFIIFFLAANNVASQNDPTFTRDQLATLADDIGVKAEQLCEYIVDVGSTNSGVSDEEKDEIIKYRLSPLFWNYAERFMKTTGGAYGTTLSTIARFWLSLKHYKQITVKLQSRALALLYAVFDYKICIIKIL